MGSITCHIAKNMKFKRKHNRQMKKLYVPPLSACREAMSQRTANRLKCQFIKALLSRHDNSEEMAMLFDLKKEGYFYTRLQNPTNDVVAKKIAELEGGVGAVLTSSGQAANFYAVFNICEAGDHIVTSNEIYGGTFNLFGVTLKKLGIECNFVNLNDSEEEIQKAFRPNTKVVFGETISNPGCAVLDIEKFARIAHKNGVPSSLTTPSLRLSTAAHSNGVPTSLPTVLPNIWMVPLHR